MSRTDVFTYLFNEYFRADVTYIVQASGFTSQQINSWLSGKTQPSKRTIEYLFHCALAPEFKVIAEFAHFQPEHSIRPQLRAALSPHQDKPGIYAFYDSMANLLY